MVVFNQETFKKSLELKKTPFYAIASAEIHMKLIKLGKFILERK